MRPNLDRCRCGVPSCELLREADAPGITGPNDSSAKRQVCPPTNLLSAVSLICALLECVRRERAKDPHKNGVGPLEWTSALGYPPCFIGSCKAQGGLLRMLSFSKEHDRNVFSCPFYCVKWGPQNLMITAPARIGFTAFNRVCSNGHPVIYDTARVISKGSNQTKSDQSGPTPFLCGNAKRKSSLPKEALRLIR